MPPPSRSPGTAELCKRNSRRSSRSSESRLMLESKNDEDVDDLFLFTEMKKHESESAAEIAYFSALQSERRDSPKASDGGKNEYNWLLTPPGSPPNGIDRELKPVDNPQNKARTQTTTTPRRSTNGKTATSPRDAKREPSRRLSSDNTKAKEKRNDIVCVGCTNSYLRSSDLISVIEEPFPAKGASEQTFGGLVNSRQEEGAQETLVDTSKHEKACGDANLMSATQKSLFEKDVLDQNAHVCATKSEAAAELSKTTEAPRNFTSEEATDAILLCNSIVHDLVYESAAIESENQMALTEISRPSLEQLVKSASDLKYFRYVYYKRNKNLQRFNKKRQEFDTKKALSDLRTDAKSKEHVKAPKIETKCNCSIM